MVIKFGKWLTRHKAVVLIIAFLLLIPATIGRPRIINIKTNSILAF